MLIRGTAGYLPCRNPKTRGDDGYEGNDENSICSSNARVGGCDRGDGGSHMVGARRNRHSAVGGCGGVFRVGRWSDLVHGRLGAQEGEIGAKSFYEVKGGGFYEVKCLPLYEVKSYWLYFGGFLGRKFGKLFGKLFGKFGS